MEKPSGTKEQPWRVRMPGSRGGNARGNGIGRQEIGAAGGPPVGKARGLHAPALPLTFFPAREIRFAVTNGPVSA